MSFIYYILNGNLCKAKEYLINNPNYNIHVCDDFAFFCSCEKGYLEIAKWLWDISDHYANYIKKNG